MKFKVTVFSVFCVFVFLGCVKMRDYTYQEDGYLGIKLKKQIGEGMKEGKDYYVTDDGAALIEMDSKVEVSKKIGMPDQVEQMVDGLERWQYKERKINLFFEDGYLKSWQEW